MELSQFLKLWPGEKYVELQSPYFEGRGSQDLILRDLNNYKVGQHNGFFYQDYKADFVDLRLRWMLDSSGEKLKATVICDGPFRLKSLLRFRKSAVGDTGKHQLQGNLYPDRDLANFTIRTTSQTGVCSLKMKWKGKSFAAHLIPESRAMEPMGFGPNRVALCKSLSTQPSMTDSKIDKSVGMFRTCGQKVPGIEVINHPLRALSKKVEMLLGKVLTDEQLLTYRPGDLLDFDNAPDLSGIFISTLYFDYDRTGSLILDLVRWHAQGGTPVWILNSKSGVKKKNRLALEAFADRYPTVQVHFLKVKGSSGNDGFKKDLATLHTVDHIKMFAVLGKNSEGSVIFGGRNIGDRYHFQKAKKSSGGFIVSGKHKTSIFYEDIDFRISDREFTESLVSQFLKLWGHRNAPFQVAPSSLYFPGGDALAAPVIEAQEHEGPWVQHQMSYPQFDNRALEKAFIRRIQKTQFQISIVTPYYQPTPAILQALLEAAERGVKVRVVTNGHYFGSGIADDLIKAANVYGVNKTFKDFEIWSYGVSQKYLHSKIFVFDDRYSILGSTNLNQRSFNYDTENVVYVNSKAVAKTLLGQVEDYIGLSHKVEEEIDPGTLPLSLFKSFKSEF